MGPALGVIYEITNTRIDYSLLPLCNQSIYLINTLELIRIAFVFVIAQRLPGSQAIRSDCKSVSPTTSLLEALAKMQHDFQYKA